MVVDKIIFAFKDLDVSLCFLSKPLLQFLRLLHNHLFVLILSLNFISNLSHQLKIQKNQELALSSGLSSKDEEVGG